jgi:LPXTG-motif cell wall-anchored protein
VLEAGCGAALADCIAADTPYLPEAEALAVYEERMTYDFVQTSAADQAVTIPAGAESLLISSHTDLTDAQRRQVLELTSIDSGYPLDEGTDGSWQRVNLAAAMAADVTVNADGSVSLVGAVDPTTPVVEDPAVVVPTDGSVPEGSVVEAGAEDQLPPTGTESGGALAAALALFLAGAALIVRRRRTGARQ